MAESDGRKFLTSSKDTGWVLKPTGTTTTKCLCVLIKKSLKLCKNTKLIVYMICKLNLIFISLINLNMLLLTIRHKTRKTQPKITFDEMISAVASLASFSI